MKFSNLPRITVGDVVGSGISTQKLCLPSACSNRDNPSTPSISIVVTGKLSLYFLELHSPKLLNSPEHTYSWVFLTFTLPNVCIIPLFPLPSCQQPPCLTEYTHMVRKIYFWKKIVTLQPSSAKEAWYCQLVKQHISFWKERYIILFSCTDPLCASCPKVQVTFWFIIVMLMVKMIWEWRCLASSACNSWLYLISGDVDEGGD